MQNQQPQQRQKHCVGTLAELPPGARKIVEVRGRSIGIFNIRGALYAIRNHCPHAGAPLCKGKITGTTAPSAPGTYVYEREGEIIRCPWHGWEFDILTGESVFDPRGCRVRAYTVDVEAPPAVERYEVRVEDARVYVYV